MTARNRQQTSKIAALSMNDWCRIIAGIASSLTPAQSKSMVKKMATKMALKWGKDEGKLAEHIRSMINREVA